MLARFRMRSMRMNGWLFIQISGNCMFTRHVAVIASANCSSYMRHCGMRLSDDDRHEETKVYCF